MRSMNHPRWNEWEIKYINTKGWKRKIYEIVCCFSRRVSAIEFRWKGLSGLSVIPRASIVKFWAKFRVGFRKTPDVCESLEKAQGVTDSRLSLGYATKEIFSCGFVAIFKQIEELFSAKCQHLNSGIEKPLYPRYFNSGKVCKVKDCFPVASCSWNWSWMSKFLKISERSSASRIPRDSSSSQWHDTQMALIPSPSVYCLSYLEEIVYPEKVFLFFFHPKAKQLSFSLSPKRVISR